jgi:hypothetical protein
MRKEGGLVVEKGGRAGIDGPVRYVGCSTHDRCVGARLLRSERRDAASGSDSSHSGVDGDVDGKSSSERVGYGDGNGDVPSEEKSRERQGPCELDLLMARYNMAHTQAERTLFPLAVARGVPVVAFTSTRWNSLQKVGGR